MAASGSSRRTALKLFWLMGETFFSIYLIWRPEHTPSHAGDWLRYANQLKKQCNGGQKFVFPHSDYRTFVSIRSQAKCFMLQHKTQRILKPNSVHCSLGRGCGNSPRDTAWSGSLHRLLHSQPGCLDCNKQKHRPEI